MLCFPINFRSTAFETGFGNVREVAKAKQPPTPLLHPPTPILSPPQLPFPTSMRPNPALLSALYIPLFSIAYIPASELAHPSTSASTSPSTPLVMSHPPSSAPHVAGDVGGVGVPGTARWGRGEGRRPMEWRRRRADMMLRHPPRIWSP